MFSVPNVQLFLSFPCNNFPKFWIILHPSMNHVIWRDCRIFLRIKIFEINITVMSRICLNIQVHSPHKSNQTYYLGGSSFPKYLTLTRWVRDVRRQTVPFSPSFPQTEVLGTRWCMLSPCNESFETSCWAH